jgi:short-subunit dehydrogenase
MNERTRRTALVTGASAGIGLAFARVLAAHDYDLILTARRRERLDALAAELTDLHQIRSLVLCGDLADAAVPERLVNEIAAHGWVVDVLINNAGYGLPGSYAATTWDQQRTFLQVMTIAVAELTHRLLPGMIERRWGRIVNVASMAGLLPGVAGHTLYAASKAMLIKFSESLSLEVARHGVLVTATCPGFTLSEFHDVTGTRQQVNQLPKFMWTTADEVAQRSYDAVMAGVPVFVPGRANATIATLSRVLPSRAVLAVMKRMSGRFRRV